MPRIGFVGLGRMGLPMCANLVRAGHQVTASDVRGELAEAATGCGARWLPATAQVAAESDVLITMLPGPGEVREAMLGSGGGIAAMHRGSTWIDMSSNSPLVVVPVRERAIERGVVVLEAPVGGGVPAARLGTLQLLVGGDADVLARHRHLLEVLAAPEGIVHVGGHGAGYTAKLLINLLWFGQAVATAEALLLGRAAGLDLGVLRQALAGSAAGGDFIRRDLDALFAGDYLESFGLDRCSEELSAVTDLARRHHLPMELSGLVAAVYERALARYGPLDGELLAVALLEEEAGLDLRHR
ncbi:NAD(P)-dependent oxidoreductase [Actinomadura scrupuli]|uniref:NAD(P)-dependent oxidoreductase n=1 Tax=Actinomadura scrupuli TaxID=559629 RepID=UPI003D998B3E